MGEAPGREDGTVTRSAEVTPWDFPVVCLFRWLFVCPNRVCPV